MKLTKISPEFENVVRDLAKALGRLEGQQGRLARRNARQAVMSTQGRLRRMLDNLYPSLRVEKVGEATVTTPLSPAQRAAIFRQKMKRRGYAPVGDSSLVTAILEGGVNITRPPKRSNEMTPYAPAWAVLAAMERVNGAFNTKKVREARGSVRVRLALLGAARLTGRLRELGLGDLQWSQQTARPSRLMTQADVEEAFAAA